MCEICASHLTQPPTGRRRRYCSRACRLAAHRAARAARKAPRLCEICGDRVPTTRRIDSTTCAERCARVRRDRRRGIGAIPGGEERFWSRIEPDHESGCWNWIGARIPSGYGSLRINNRAVAVYPSGVYGGLTPHERRPLRVARRGDAA